MCVLIEGKAVKRLNGIIVEEIEAPALLNEECMHQSRNETLYFDYEVEVQSEEFKCLILNQRQYWIAKDLFRSKKQHENEALLKRVEILHLWEPL